MTIIGIIVVGVINSLLSLAVLSFLYVQYRTQVNGIQYWLVSLVLSMLGFTISITRVFLPETPIILISNGIQLVAFIYLSKGLSELLGQSMNERINIGLVLVGLLGVTYFAVIDPVLRMRTVILYATLMALTLSIATHLTRQKSQISHRSLIVMRVTLGINAVIHGANVIFSFFGPEPESYLSGNVYTTIGHISLIFGVAILTYAQVVLVSDKLLDKVVASEEKLNLIFDRSPLPVIVTRLVDGQIQNANTSFLKTFGYTIPEILGRKTSEIHLWADSSDRGRFITLIQQTKRVDDFEAVFCLKNGEQRICRINSQIIQLADDHSQEKEPYLLSSIYDITNDVHLREDLKHLATHDHLTGLANRILFYENFDRDKARADRHHHQLAVIALDLNRLKVINDSHGHPAGDAVLVHLAQSIGSVLRKSDTFARFGGDEFCILLDEINSVADVEAVLGKILEQVTIPYLHQGSPISISVSMGVALYPQDAESADELIQRADTALYSVKRNRETAYAYFRSPR